MRKIPSLIALLGMIGMIGCIAPIQGGAQNPRNYQRTIRVTDELVEVFEGDGMMILLETYTGAVKGTSVWANLLPVSPSELERTRFSTKNGQNFWIDMNTIQGLTEIYGLGGSDPATLHSNNQIEVWGAGPMTFYYKANGKDYYVSSDVNHFGVTQWAGADLPASTILVVEDGSELNGTFSTEGFLYLAESEVIGVPEWPTYGMWWINYHSSTNYTILFEYEHEVKVGDLLDAVFTIGQYGNTFLLSVAFDDGTSNGLSYSHGDDFYTLKDHRSIAVTGISLNKEELTLIRLRSERLVATVLPSNATNRKVGWHSSDPMIASVDETGLVTAHEAGEVIITATTEDGGYTASCLVTVTFNTSVEEVETTKIQIHGQQVTVFGNGEVKIHDLSGKIIRSGEVVGSGDFFLNKGVYLLQMGERIQKIAVF